MNYTIAKIVEQSPPHKHKTHEIIIYKNGEGVFHMHEKEILLSRDKMVVVPPETVHSSQSDSPFERIFINGRFNEFFP